MNGKSEKGTVRWFNIPKGYGFIAPTNGGKDVMVRSDAVQAAGLRTLMPGDQLAFEVMIERGTAVAVNLRKI